MSLSLFKTTPCPIGLESQPYDLSNLIYLLKCPISKYSHIGVKASTCKFWEYTIQSITVWISRSQTDVNILKTLFKYVSVASGEGA